MSMASLFGLGLGQNLMNYFLFNQGQERQERLGREAMGIAEQDREYLNNPETFLAGLPGVRAGSTQTGDGSIDLDSLFKMDERYKDLYENAFASQGPDWDAVKGDISTALAGREGLDWLKGAEYGVDQRAQDVGGYFPTDASFRESLNADLAGIGAAGRSKAQLDRNQMIGQALASGKNLQDVQSDLDRYQFDADSNRALQAAQARGSNEQLRNAAALTRAQTMATASNTQSQINAALAQAGASEIGTNQRKLADLEFGIGDTQAKTALQYAADSTSAAQGDQQKANDYLDRLYQMVFAPRTAANYQAAGNMKDIDSMMAQILAGVPVGTYQTDFSGIMNAVGAERAARAGKQDQPTGFNFLGIGGSW